MKKKFVPYILYGYPNIKKSLEKALEYKDVADIYEIGFPFSDPIADGNVIQNASSIALKNEINFSEYIEFIKVLKQKTGKLVFSMTYLNPILKFGIAKFIKSSIDGFIIPDLIVDESKEILKLAKKYNKQSVFIVTPDTTDLRLKKIGKCTTGFIYYVTYSGVTGGNTSLNPKVLNRIKKIKRITNKKVFVGFGIKTKSDIKTVYKYADGAIVGSAILNNTFSPKFLEGLK